eukprot:scaffold1323_cov160-Amphora_coffeaeformis.AAC.8
MKHYWVLRGFPISFPALENPTEYTVFPIFRGILLCSTTKYYGTISPDLDESKIPPINSQTAISEAKFCLTFQLRLLACFVCDFGDEIGE